jgi:hypothetical protein
MKYTAIINQDGLQIVPVNGCTTCPHMSKEAPIGAENYMQCNRGEDFSKRKKKLIGKWTGAYHESCQLPSTAKPFAP